MKKYCRILSIFLTVIMLFTISPLQVLAETPDVAGDKTGTGPIVNQNNLKHDPQIIGEVISKRGEYSKTFFLDNMSYETDLYPYAVHYLENGQWQDIDNTLIDGTDEDNNNILENKQSDYKVKISKNTNSNNLVRIQKENYELTWSVNDIQKSLSEVEPLDISKLDLLSDNDKKRTLTKLTSTVDFKNVLPNTDLQYKIMPGQVKENIILNQNVDNPQFSVTFHTKNAIPKLQKDNSIIFYDEKDPSKEVFQIKAPIMYDAMYEDSTNIAVQLNETQDGYALTIKPDKEWLNDSSRVYPVIIDPTVSTTLDRAYIHDACVSQNYPTTNYGGISMLKTGYGSTTGADRSYIQFTLPALNSGDMVIGAYMNLNLYSANPNYREVDVHKSLGNWSEYAITWNNQPGFDSKTVDYQIVHDKKQYVWDVTSIVRDWYNTGNNYGLVIKHPVETSDYGYNEFYSSETSDTYASLRPFVQINYVNNSGLENYWTYHSQDAGRAGTGYINDFNGNLIFIHNDLSMNGNRMPLTINHVYNSNDKDHANDIGYGDGWRLNLSQRITPKTIGTTQYYQYIDEDGTRHYFYYDSSSGIWKDESGLNLTMTINTGSTVEYYKIIDKGGNQLTFTSSGYLYKIKDSNNNAISLAYNGTTLTSVTDGAGRVTKLESTSDGYLTGIVDPSGRRTSFAYTGTQLTTITYPDGNYTTYNYDSFNNLLSATNYDGYKITYQYYSSSPYRVKEVQESNTNGTQGGKLDISYGYNSTTFTDIKGRKNIYQFNNSGNTVSLKDDNGDAQYYKYNNNTNDPNNNKLQVESKLQKTVTNYLLNHDAEVNSSWVDDYWPNSTGTCSYTTEDKYLGNQSLKIIKTNNLEEKAYKQNITLVRGQTYTFSAYVKTISISNTNNEGADLRITYQDSYGNWVTTPSTYIRGTNDWNRIELTFTLPADASSTTVIARAAIDGETGTAYFDCLQLEDGPIANRYNLVENADLTYGSGTPTFWTKNSSTTISDTLTTADSNHPSSLSGNVFQITGNASLSKGIYQVINLSGNANDVFVVGGWAKGDSVPLNNGSGRYFALDVGMQRTSDGGYDWYVVPFNEDSSDWQYVSDVIVAKDDYKSMTIYGLYYNNLNTAYFDGFQLYKEEFGQSYKYDANGNVMSTTDLAAQNSWFQYNSNNDLVKLTDPKGNDFTYAYDGSHNILNATSAENVVYSFSYDPYGNPKTATVGSTSGLFINSSASYTADGNYIKSVTDGSGNTVGYNYNEAKDQLSNTVDANSRTTYYSYDNMGRMTGVYKYPASDNIELFPLNDSTTGNKGTTAAVDNAAFTTDSSGKAVFVSSSTSNVSYNLGISKNSGTMAVWMNSSGDTGTTRYIITNNIYGQDPLLCVYTRPDNYLYVAARDTSGVWQVVIKSTDTIVNNTWYFVAYSWQLSGTTLNLNLYLNGKKYTGSTSNFEDFSGLPTSVGSFANGVYYLNGQLEQFGYSPATLSDSDINSIYQNGRNNYIKNSYTYQNDRISSINENGVNYNFGYDSLGNNTTVSVGNQNLINNTYETSTGNLLKSTYGNGENVSYDYDGLDRVTADRYNGNIRYKYDYDANGNVGYVQDLVNGVNYRYIYDTSDRLVKVEDSNGNTTKYDFDVNNNVSKVTENIDNTVRTTTYGYDRDNRLKTVTGNNDDTQTYNYDSIGRLTSSTMAVNGAQEYNTQYNYQIGANGSSTTKVSSINNNGNTISYTYDKNGNIQTIIQNGKVITYSYNELNELVREDNQVTGQAIVYSYDAGGNFTGKTEYAYTTGTPANPTTTHSYVYGDTNWKDKLTSYDGNTINYDAIGNPTSYAGWTYNWEDGRQLSGMSGNGYNIGYKYDDDGIRTQKTVNGVKTNYIIDGNKVIRETSSLDNTGFNTYQYIYLQNDTWVYRGFDIPVSAGKSYIYSFDAYISPDANISDAGTTYIADGEDGIQKSFYYDNSKKGTWQHFEYIQTSTSNNAKILLYPITSQTPATTGYITYKNVLFRELGSNNNLFKQPQKDDDFSIIGNGVFECDYDNSNFVYNTYQYNYSQNDTWVYRGFDIPISTGKSYIYSFDAYISPDANISDTGTTYIADGEDGIQKSFYYDNSKKGTWQHFEYIQTSTSNNAKILLYPITSQTPATTGYITYKNVLFRELGSNNNLFKQSQKDDDFSIIGNGVFECNNENNYIIYYTYDTNGNLISMNLNGIEYYYIRNAQGDIIGLYDNTGTQVVSYTYDSWGKLISTTGPLSSTVGVINPYRYRGYRYDTETGLYYLQSRYYNPDWGRFLNIDANAGYIGELLTHNVFAYTANNPINREDPNGTNFIADAGGAGFGAELGDALLEELELAEENIDAEAFISEETAAENEGMHEEKIIAAEDFVENNETNNDEGPYSNLKDPKNVKAGKDFTPAQKNAIIEENMKRNGGVVKSDLSGDELVKPSKSMKGMTPPQNEWQIDHINPKDNGGTNSYSNAQVLSRQENRMKGNSISIFPQKE